MSNNKIATYLLYALGEIFLVVVGILIAVQIDDWNTKNQVAAQELDNYQDIINDLKKDSSRIITRIKFAKRHQDTYYDLYDISRNKSTIDSAGYYDYLVRTITFDPITKANHQNTIQDLRNHEIRDNLNSYFANEYRVRQASEEFNKLINTLSRPYFLEDNNAFSYSGVFIEDKYKFPPSLGVTGIDPLKIKPLTSDDKFLSILAELRMSLGWFLFEIETLNTENSNLIKTLESKLK